MFFILKKKFYLFLVILINFVVIACSKDQDYDKSKAVLAYVQDNSLEIDIKLQNNDIVLPKTKPNNSFLGSLSIFSPRMGET